ncbi:MAG: hypothetical protein AB1508_12950 [Pseudomonadota bacterium]
MIQIASIDFRPSFYDRCRIFIRLISLVREDNCKGPAGRPPPFQITPVRAARHPHRTMIESATFRNPAKGEQPMSGLALKVTIRQ